MDKLTEEQKALLIKTIKQFAEEKNLTLTEAVEVWYESIMQGVQDGRKE